MAEFRDGFEEGEIKMILWQDTIWVGTVRGESFIYLQGQGVPEGGRTRSRMRGDAAEQTEQWKSISFHDLPERAQRIYLRYFPDGPPNAKPAAPKACTCETLTLMRDGCTCGSITRYVPPKP